MFGANPYRVLVAIVFAIVCSLAHAKPPVRVRVDMPSGGCNLTVWQDGSASIHYGAMPRWIHSAAGTFEFGQLVIDLRRRSYVQSIPAPGNSDGTVSLPMSEDLLTISDKEFVRSLLKHAWKSRACPKTPQDAEDYDWVSKACSLP